MCGIAGFVATTGGMSAADMSHVASAMARTLIHRGPDDSGTWIDEATGVALAHRRLSILDLSEHGHQPMMSACGRYSLVLNGEIYNFKEIRQELKDVGHACNWRGHSDTEVVLAAIARWGLRPALQRLVGMFAFALWDREARTLFLVRDRLGEKPLYYGWSGSTFLFGSELKALRAHPAWRGEIDRNSLALLMRYSYVPSPYCIYKDVFKLLPGTVLSVSAATSKAALYPEPYWSARDMVRAASADPFTGTDTQAIDAVERLLKDSVRQQMVADVPLGAFLSGGIDSSTVVALMQAQSPRPVKTFTIGFHETGYNEAEHALAVARHLGTDHTELYVTPEEARAVIPRLPLLYDEPFSDSSQIPTFLVAQLARSQVTVSLSGDGGDELFGGYNRYLWGRAVWDKARWAPRVARRIVAHGMRTLSPEQWNRGFATLERVLPSRLRQRLPGEKLHKLAGVLGEGSPEAMYLGLVSHWKAPTLLVRGAQEPETAATAMNGFGGPDDFTRRMMFLDLVSYLPDDILVKVDRAAMGVSLETRVPMLDHRLVEFAWRLPENMKIRDGEGKWILRRVLDRYVPRELIERPKMGFGVPIDTWLRGPLRDWAEALLSENRLQDEGYFDPQPIRRKWDEHLSGRRNWQHHLWDVLMFQAWLEAQS